MCSVCERLLSKPDKGRNCSPTIQLSIKRNATSKLRSPDGWRFGCKPPVFLTIGLIFVVARQISARSSQWKSSRNFRSHDGYRNAVCQSRITKAANRIQCGERLLDLEISTPLSKEDFV